MYFYFLYFPAKILSEECTKYAERSEAKFSFKCDIEMVKIWPFCLLLGGQAIARYCSCPNFQTSDVSLASRDSGVCGGERERSLAFHGKPCCKCSFSKCKISLKIISITATFLSKVHHNVLHL